MMRCAVAMASCALLAGLSGRGLAASPEVHYAAARDLVNERSPDDAFYRRQVRFTLAAGPQARKVAAAGFQVRLFPADEDGEPIAWPGPPGCHVYVTWLARNFVMTPGQASFVVVDSLDDLGWLRLEKGRPPAVAYYRVAFETPNAEGSLFWLNDAQKKAYFDATLLLRVQPTTAAPQAAVDAAADRVARNVVATSAQVDRERPGHVCAVAVQVSSMVAASDTVAEQACGGGTGDIVAAPVGDPAPPSSPTGVRF